MIKGVGTSLDDSPGSPERRSCHDAAAARKKGSISTWDTAIMGKRHLIYVCSFFKFKDSPTKSSAKVSWILDATGTDVQIKQVFNATQKGFKRQAWCQRVPAEVVPSNYLHFV